ncbi:MAG: hypothetical protein ACR5K4_02910 [Sodalis sp. (in: enterobacteria)]
MLTVIMIHGDKLKFRDRRGSIEYDSLVIDGLAEGNTKSFFITGMFVNNIVQSKGALTIRQKV